jgi:hypothetical protein
MNKRTCAYCGEPALKQDKEHVFPRCLYPPSKAQSKVQRLTVPACKSCNNGWSDDEAHFRNILTLAGDPNSSRLELFNTNVMRSFDEVDGIRRMDDLIARMKPVIMDDGSSRHMVYPGEDQRVLRVVKKVVRGLCYYHNVVWPISDNRVWVDVIKYVIPKSLFDQMNYHHREQDIAEYRYQVLNDHEINSAWLITFFQRITFVGLVSILEKGFS